MEYGNLPLEELAAELIDLEVRLSRIEKELKLTDLYRAKNELLSQQLCKKLIGNI